MERDSRNFGATLAFELLPAAIFNFAVAFAVASTLRQSGYSSLAAEASVGAGLAAFLIVWMLLRRVGRVERRFHLPDFDSLTVEAEPLLLDCPAAPADEELAPSQPDEPGELLLEDIVESIGPESRVIRLFQPGSVPTAGELQARIDRHLHSAPPQTSGDAAQELRDALTALKQSLR